MKQTIIILSFFIFCCTKRQESKEITSVDVVTDLIANNSKFNFSSTTVCEQTSLSNQFDIRIDFKRYTDTIELQDSCYLKLFIKDKNSKSNLDSIIITSLFYFKDIFSNCDSMTSYSTKFNSNRQIVDNYYGDIVVADLNFDNKDDIAVINECGGNAGPLYNYYIQTSEHRFILDRFLTDSVTFFPDEIDKSNHRIVTLVHAGACCVGEHVYHLEKTTNKWKQTSHKILGL